MSAKPHQRDETQAVMSATMNKDLIAALDEYCALNDMSRSQFLREVIYDELTKRGVKIDSEASKGPPSRLTKNHFSFGKNASHGDGNLIINS